MAEQPKSGFYIAVGLVVVALIAFAVYRSRDVIAPPAAPVGGGGGAAQGKIDPKEVAQPPESTADTASPTTVKEYHFKPAEKLPPVKGIAAYKPLANDTVRFALNIWAGWAPIVLANNGFKAGQEWTGSDGKKFKVELVLIDNPVAMRDAYAAGEVPIGWATLDMVPLFLETFVGSDGSPKDSRIMPAFTSRSTSPTAAMESWSARTSRPPPIFAGSNWCWPRILPRTILRSTCWSRAVFNRRKFR